MESIPSKRLYLKGLRKDVTQEELTKHLSFHGKICEVKVLPNYAFIQFESEEDASRVVATYKNQPLLGKNTVVEFAHPLRKDMPSISSSGSSPKSHSFAHRPSQRQSRHPVVVLDLPRDIGWQELKDFGRLSGMLVAYCDLDKTQKGRGFIEFFTREDAKRAVGILDGRRLSGTRVRVIDHEDVRKLSQYVRRRNRSRSRSPRRPSSSDRVGSNDYSWNSAEFYSSTHQPRSLPRRSSEIEYNYDHQDRRHSFSAYPSHPSVPPAGQEETYSIRGAFSTNGEITDYDPYPALDRVSAWQAEHYRHHDCYDQGHNYSDRMGTDGDYGRPYGSCDPGYQARLHEVHHLQRLLDPYH